MKAGWQTKTLGEVLQKTETVNPLQRPETEFDYIDVSSISNQTFQIEETQRLTGKDAPSRARRLVKSNDILFATVRPTLRRIVIVPSELDHQVCSTGYFVLRPKPELDYRFVFYFLFSEDFMGQMEKLQKGASYPAVTDGEVRMQTIPVPPLPEQRRLVALLDAAFAAIATAKANTEQTLQNARAVFDSHLEAVFSQQGAGWEEKALGEIAKHSLGKMLDKAKNKGEAQPYLRNLNVRWFDFDLSDVQEMRFLPEEAAKYTAVRGDVLICEGGYPGRAAIWEEDTPIYFQKALHRVRFHEPAYNKWFLYFLYSQEKSGELRRHFTGTGIQHFTGEALGRLRLPVTSVSETQSFVEKIEKLAEETQRLEALARRKRAALDELKQALLHQAFAGAL